MKPYDIKYDTKTGVFNTSLQGQTVMNQTTETTIAGMKSEDNQKTTFNTNKSLNN